MKIENIRKVSFLLKEILFVIYAGDLSLDGTANCLWGSIYEGRKEILQLG